MQQRRARHVAAILLVLLLVVSLLTTTSAASSVETSGTCTVVTSKQPWWDVFGWSRPKISITNKSGKNILLYVETADGRYEANGVALRKGKTTEIKLKKYQHTYTVYASGGIWNPYCQKIQVKAKSNINYIW